MDRPLIRRDDELPAASDDPHRHNQKIFLIRRFLHNALRGDEAPISGNDRSMIMPGCDAMNYE